MNRYKKLGSFVLFALAGVAACGEPAAMDGSGGTGPGGDGTGGQSASGGANVGGTHSGGQPSSGGTTGDPDGGAAGDSGTGGNIPEDAHCAPGDRYDVIAYLGLLSNCGMVDGVGDDQFSTRSINLETTIGPGDTYAFSVEMGTTGANTMDFWGATEECGDGLELLGTAVMGEGIRCVEFAPQNGSYSHVTWVWHGGGAHGDVTFCPAGSCAE